MRNARIHFEAYFERLRKLVAASGGVAETKAWRTAKSLLHFPEIKGTCLGYGVAGISGSGVGEEMRDRLVSTAHEIVSLGIDDPDLFLAMGLFEEDFGPDLIGDMFTNVCLGQILRFSERVFDALEIKTRPFKFRLKNGTKFEGQLAENPAFPDSETPVILMPKDILQDLPMALDWAGVQDVSARNAEFRDDMNEDFSRMWSKKTLESKDKLRGWALSSQSSFGNLLDMLHGMDGEPYDFAGDKLGEIIWRTLGDRIVAEFPQIIDAPAKRDESSLIGLVEKILEQFRFLIEDRDLWKDLYVSKGKVRLEQASQRMFYAIAYAYCEANNLDITPEAYAGRGPVDFKFSKGFKQRILIEVKLSTNTRLFHGYEKQLALYDAAENPIRSYFLIMDVGKLGRKLKKVRKLEELRHARGQGTPRVIVIDGSYRDSASKAA